MLEHGPFEPKRFGEMLDLHHAQLRDRLGISTPKLESLIEGCKKFGALGGKLNGSGGGGTMIAYAPGREADAAAAINVRGGKAYVVRQSRGATIEHGPEGL